MKINISNKINYLPILNHLYFIPLVDCSSFLSSFSMSAHESGPPSLM